MKLGTRKLLVGAMLVTTALTTVGCRTKEKSGGTSDSDKKVTLRMSWWGNDDRHKVTLEAIEAFEAANPNITVKAEYSGWDGIVEKMATQIAGGTEPDVMQINYDWYTTYSPDGKGFYDLNKLKDTIDLSGYTEEVLKAGTVDGILNGIPHGENAYVMGVNQTMYEKFGVDIHNLKTWDDYIEAAKKFDDGYYPTTIATFYEITTYLSQLTGKALLDEEGNIQYSKAELKKGFEWYQKLVDAKVTPDKKSLIENFGTAHKSTSAKFIEGNYDGFFDWTGGLASYSSVLAEKNQNLGVPTYPTLAGANTNGVIKKPTMLFSISKNTKHPKEAAKLLNFLLNDPKGVALMGVARGLPVNTKAVKILEENNQIDELTAKAHEYLVNTTGITESPYFEMSAVVEAYESVLEQFGLGKLSASQAADETIKQVKAAVEEIKSSQ
jgi:oligogalacturonide transport system substrate-binding protein